MGPTSAHRIEAVRSRARSIFGSPGEFERRNPKSMWMRDPSACRRMLPLCRSLTCEGHAPVVGTESRRAHGFYRSYLQQVAYDRVGGDALHKVTPRAVEPARVRAAVPPLEEGGERVEIGV